jgi:hypothetical protein
MHRNPKWTGESAGSYHALLQSLTKRIWPPLTKLYS